MLSLHRNTGTLVWPEVKARTSCLVVCASGPTSAALSSGRPSPKVSRRQHTPRMPLDHMQTYDKDESGQIEFNEFLLMFRNSLLDLKAMRQYMADDYTGPLDSTGNVIDVSASHSSDLSVVCGGSNQHLQR